MGEEYKEMYPKDMFRDPVTKQAFKQGITSFQSDSADLLIEHSLRFPVTIVLFYDSDIYLPSVMNSLSLKILDVFVYKFES
jgi:hypothetical protein